MKKTKFFAILSTVLQKLKTSTQDYCSLETVHDNHIVSNDGSMVSILRFKGTKSILGHSQFKLLIEDLADTLFPFLNKRGHQIQVLFYHDMDARASLEENARRQKESARKIGLNLNDLIEENVDNYAKYIYDEECYFALWSRPSLLDPIESKTEASEKGKLRKEINFPAAKDAQNILRPISFLIDRHEAFVQKIFSDFASSEHGISVELLSIDRALHAIKSSIAKTLTSPQWTPSIPTFEHNGDARAIPVRWKTDESEDYSVFLYPTLAEQIMTTNAIIGDRKLDPSFDPTIVRYGDKFYAPVVFDAPPRDPKSFNALFNTLNNTSTKEAGQNKAMPYAISFMLEGDGMSANSFKGIISSIFAFGSSNNKNIVAANKALKELENSYGKGYVIRLKMTAMTWASATNEGLQTLVLRKSKFIRALEGWGNPIISDRLGDPMDGLQSNALALAPTNVGPVCPAPLIDALYMLPITRPASPFDQGSIVYRSLDGKELRYQRFSSIQTTWVTCIAGKPGTGKSLLMNSNNFEVALMPDANKLPWVMTIDIGISSSGLINLLKDALPTDKKHLVMYERLQNTHTKSINPLDTPLGLRYPLPSSFEFMKNFITMLVTPAERQSPLEGMTSFVGTVLSRAFDEKSDTSDKQLPETYKPGHNTIVDEGVERLRDFHIRPATKYWELVDAFFDAGMLHEAEVAQRYAVPTLVDLTRIANSEDIKEQYGGSAKELIDRFTVGIKDAISDYPVFAEYTKFDLGSARVVSLDLQDVAVSASTPSAYKQTALMYMIARQLFMQKIAFSEEDLKLNVISKRYYNHYYKLVMDIIDDLKILAMDEYHRTGKHQALQSQVLSDSRESRKWQLEIILASQLIEDFGDILKMATSIFVLDPGTKASLEVLRTQVGITPEQEAGLKRYVRGPRPYGSTFLGIFVTTEQNFTQLFTFSPGPIRLWALSTTAEDRKLRTLIYNKLPHDTARIVLAKRFPSGSCKRFVEQLKNERAESNDGFIDEAEENSIIENLASEILNNHFSTSAV